MLAEKLLLYAEKSEWGCSISLKCDTLQAKMKSVISKETCTNKHPAEVSRKKL